MSYFAVDIHGYIDDVASIGGFLDFTKAAAAYPGIIADFAQAGETERPQDLADALADVTFDNPSADSVRQQMVKCADLADGVLLVSDGMDTDDPAFEIPDEPAQNHRDRIAALLLSKRGITLEDYERRMAQARRARAKDDA